MVLPSSKCYQLYFSLITIDQKAFLIDKYACFRSLKFMLPESSECFSLIAIYQKVFLTDNLASSDEELKVNGAAFQ